MTDNTDFSTRIDKLKKEIKDMDHVNDTEIIENTASRLEKLNYAPPIITPLATFFRLSSKTLLVEVDRLLALPDAEACALAPDEPEKCQDMRIQFISVLIFYYKKLVLLRRDDNEAWDEIDELYIHD